MKMIWDVAKIVPPQAYSSSWRITISYAYFPSWWDRLRRRQGRVEDITYVGDGVRWFTWPEYRRAGYWEDKIVDQVLSVARIRRANGEPMMTNLLEETTDDRHGA